MRLDKRPAVVWAETRGVPRDRECLEELGTTRTPYVFKVTGGKTALLPLDEYTGRASLEAVATPRDLPALTTRESPYGRDS